MKQAIHFGAGNIGRGFIGALLNQSGYDVIFADVNEQMIEALNARGKYTVHIMDLEPGNFEVGPVSSFHTADPLLVEKIAESEVITTAVGLNILPRIASAITQGIEERAKRGVEGMLYVIACENGLRASSRLTEEVSALLSPQALQYCMRRVNFIDCSVDRIVPPVKTEELTDVCVERFHEWNVDSTQLKGELRITGMNAVDNLAAYMERKLFTLNTGHAILAYLGYVKGYVTIEECTADLALLSVVRSAMSESGAALVQKFELNAAEHDAYIEQIIQRFRNPYLGDTVSRIGRDPLRKLSPEDRLIAPLKTACGFGLPVEHLLLGIGAALHYYSPDDPESIRLQDTIRELGIAEAVAEITNIPAGSPLNEQIKKAYHGVMKLPHFITETPKNNK